MPLTPEERLEYVINVLKHTAEWSPSFKDVATENGIVNANKAQIKLKKIIDDTGKYKLVAGKVVAVDAESEAPATPVKSPGRPKKAASDKKTGKGKPAAPKKRKIEDVEAEDAEDQDNDNDEAAVRSEEDNGPEAD